MSDARFELCKAAAGYSGVLMLGKFHLEFPASSWDDKPASIARVRILISAWVLLPRLT